MENWVNDGNCHSLKYRKVHVEQVWGGTDESMRSLMDVLQLLSHGQSPSGDVLPSVGFLCNQSLLRYTGL